MSGVQAPEGHNLEAKAVAGVVAMVDTETWTEKTERIENKLNSLYRFCVLAGGFIALLLILILNVVLQG